MTSTFVTFRDKVEALFTQDLSAIEAFLKPIIAEVKPVADADLKAIAQAGLAAGLAVVTGGGSLTLTTAETAAIAAGRAIVADAAAKGTALTEQTGLAIAAAAGLATTTTTTTTVNP